MSMASVAISPVHEDSLNFQRYFLGKYGLNVKDSILIFLSVGGSVIPMRVQKSDSIASVKLRIQASKGFFFKKQKLVFEGRELARNNSHVRDYGVGDGKILYLVIRFSDLQAVTVRTVSGKEFEFQVERGRNVGYVKQQIAKKEKEFNLIDQELIYDGEELEDRKLITDISKSKEAVIHLLVRKSAKVREKAVGKELELSIEAIDLNDNEPKVLADYHLGLGCRVPGKISLLRGFLLEPVIVSLKVELPKVIKQLIDSTLKGLEAGNEPIRSSEGSGGVYFMQDSSGQRFVSVFKPMDEEPMAVNNPQGLPKSVDGEGLKKGTRVGQGALREVAAFILDHPKNGPCAFHDNEMGLAGVPPTVMVNCLHSGFNHLQGFDSTSRKIKTGSLQMFKENIGCCEEMGPGAFPVDQVHKISILDMRLANTDRHAGNILVSKDSENGQIVLIPIDHGYCLPESFEDCTFEWLYWPQARQPFSADMVEYIKSLDAEQDIALLKFHGWDIPPECARTLRISTMLLKKGVEREFSPLAIGKIMCRETVKKESLIEQIVREAEDSVLPGTSEVAFLESVSSIMDRCLDELTT